MIKLGWEKTPKQHSTIKCDIINQAINKHFNPRETTPNVGFHGVNNLTMEQWNNGILYFEFISYGFLPQGRM